MIRTRLLLFCLLALALASCSSAPTPKEQIATTELAKLAPLKAKYPAIVTDFDITGTRLDLSIDANGYIETGDDDVARFKVEAAKAWRSAWEAAHPHKHAMLTLRFIDFINRVWFSERLHA